MAFKSSRDVAETHFEAELKVLRDKFAAVEANSNKISVENEELRQIKLKYELSLP